MMKRFFALFLTACLLMSAAGASADSIKRADKKNYRDKGFWEEMLEDESYEEDEFDAFWSWLMEEEEEYGDEEEFDSFLAWLLSDDESYDEEDDETFGALLAGFLEEEDYEEDDDGGSFLSWLLDDEEDYSYEDDDEENGSFLSWLLSDGGVYEKPEDWAPIGASGDPDQTWSIYWYLCGSDLESEIGAATDDLLEVLEVELPENVQIVIQTGGAGVWQNDLVDSSRIQRYLYNHEGLNLVDETRQANMGDPDTLADFLRFCKKHYPAEKTMVVFWNHGGGSVAGASFDENYNYDALTLKEFYEGFDAAYDLSVENPPIDVIGFDTCLMATIDTAYTFADIGRYLVASEEFESSIGWEYARFLEELAKDPGMDGARLAQVICDTYMEGCYAFDVADEATLSVVDLGRVGPLLEAYEHMGEEALTCALNDPSFFSSFGREAKDSENYGGNTRSEGYANMVDLGHLAENCEYILPQTAQAVQDALEDCVLYKVQGPYRENATGLSCYYSYNSDRKDFEGYLEQGCSDAFKSLFYYAFGGEFSEEGLEYINSLGFEEEELPYVPDLAEDGDEEYPLYLDDEGLVVLELEPDIVNMLKGVYFQLAYIDEEEDLILLLGQDNDMDADWDNGIFKDNFRGMWGALDGNLVYMEVSYECDEYTAFAVPILLNGREYNLRVIYDYEDEEFYILGARRGLEDNGMADRNLVQLQPGDEITTIHYASSMSGDDDFVQVPVDTFTVTENTAFAEEDMGDGTFLLMFEMVDAKNNYAYSEMVQFTVEGEYMDVEILD